MKKFPFRYLGFTIFVLIESVLYFKGWNDMVYFPVNWEQKSGHFVVTDVNDETFRSGFRNGDIIESLDGKKFYYTLITDVLDNFHPDQIIDAAIIRDGRTLHLPVKLESVLKKDLSFFISYYTLILIILALGIFVLFRKAEDKSAKIFFIFTQVFALCLHSNVFIGSSEFGIIRNAIFYFTFPFLGTVLIHFFLRFPIQNKIIRKVPGLPGYFYAGTLILSLAGLISNLLFIWDISSENIELNLQILNISILWMSICLLIATFIGIYNFFTVKGTVIHNQYRWIMFGICFGLLPETAFGFFQDYFQSFNSIIPHLIEYIWGAGALVLIVFFSLAILKYKLWEIEVIIKRGLQYSIITLFLAGTYLILINITELYFNPISESYKIPGIILTAFLFIPVREIIQNKIDKLFYREPYNPTSAVLEFENNVITNYAADSLYSMIGKQIDEIFHFSEFIFVLKGPDKNYSPVYSTNGIEGSFRLTEIITNSADNFINAVPANLPSGLEKAEFLFPIRKGDENIGWFICGDMKSERPYSKQDFELLTVLANRASTIIQMSEMYKSELRRKEAVEKERARISRDMHDEIGSGLTQIALLSELVRGDSDNKIKTNEVLRKISTISRETIDSISEIVWALNPKNDYLDHLTAYIREYSSDLFESAGINYKMNFSQHIPPVVISADFRKNIFLAIKEILNNIIKHANASNVNFDLCIDDRCLIIIITDDGGGFVPEQISLTGNGLKNINKRIEDAGGSIKILSEINKGTAVNIKLLLK